MLSSRGEIDAAIDIWQQAYEEDPTRAVIANAYAEALADSGKKAKLADFVPKSPLPTEKKTYFLLRAEQNQEVVDMATETLGKAGAVGNDQYDGRDFVRINRAIALKRLRENCEMMADLEFLETKWRYGSGEHQGRCRSAERGQRRNVRGAGRVIARYYLA